MTTRDIESYFRQHRRFLAVLMLVVCMMAVSGVFVGMRQTTGATRSPSAETVAPPRVAADPHVPQAPRYADIKQAGWLANNDWTFTLENLPQAPANREPVACLSAVELEKVLASRAERRAFDGAPPTIPHDINTMSVSSCMVCHSREATLMIDGKRPPAISHASYTSCTQCHVPADGLRRLTEQERLVVGSAFDGREAPGPGTRAFSGAPPTMPHPVFMRENCMSCHGADRPQAIRSSHPQRQNCLQCHAQDGAADNRERTEASLRP